MNPPNPKEYHICPPPFLTVISLSSSFRFARKRNCSQFSRIRSASRSGSSLEREVPGRLLGRAGSETWFPPVAPKGKSTLAFDTSRSPPNSQKAWGPHQFPPPFLFPVTIPCHSHIPGQCYQK